jgi:ClpP class serine protease
MRLFPLARVIVLIPILFIPLFFEVHAFVFVGLWFVLQILQGTLELMLPSSQGGVAWWAHIGGFVAGFVLGPILVQPEWRYPKYYPDQGHPGLRHGRTRLISTIPWEVSMSFGDLVWLFFIFSAIQPMLQQRMLEAMRVRKIAQLESERKSRVILLVHRQETMRFLGFPVARYIDINDSEEVLRAIQMTDEKVPLDLILHTPGGLVLAALQIAKAARDHKAKVTVFVPHYAMSGGTLIALAADEIVMCAHSVLGPIDPQLGQSPAASLIKVVEQKPIARIDDQTLVLADVGRKAITQVKESATELLQRRLTAEQASVLAEKLATGTWTHDYPIWASTARTLGLLVSTDMPNAVLDLMKLYPQPLRAQSAGGVEYLPIPRQNEPAGREA